nr:immunoglobulin light chain junction region [Macaca mulatta]MOV61989.1 immunoglobulin light chain junction region [Macaca mulatta]MOV62392.1 immunoglobulin light chain junction region [Macaca mulatta]MOV65702.1 immunoglobulin light chain junction region [Macaca mulatta]
CLQDYGLPWTF